MNNLLLSGGGGGICSQVIVFKDGILTPVNWNVIHESFSDAEELYLSVVENNVEISLLELEGRMVDGKLQLIGRDYGKQMAYVLNESSKNLVIIPNIFIGPSYKSLERVSDYLYLAEYENLNYELAKDYYEKHAMLHNVACSAVRSGFFFGRNFDWYYNHDVDFIIRTKALKGRHATLGVAGSIPGLTKDFLKSGKYSEKFDILPFFLLDGVNDSGVFCNTNVVPLDKGDTTITTPLQEEYDRIPSFMVPRYVLDNFSSALEAIEYLQKHVAIYIIDATKNVGYDLHFMIGDSFHTYVCEIINNEFKYVEQDIMTNFHIFGTIFNNNGLVYTPVTQDTTHNAMDTNKITKHGSGLERYNIARQNINNADTKLGMINLMHNLLNYNKSYTNTGDDTWYTEFVGKYPSGDYTVKTTPEKFEEVVMPIVRQRFVDRNRDDENQTIWHTTHTSVYDLTNKVLYIYDSTEDNIEHMFALDNGLFEAGKGLHSVQTKNSQNFAIGDYTFVSGYGGQAQANYSKVGGFICRTLKNDDEGIDARYARADGYMTDAAGLASSTDGDSTHTQNIAEHAQGRGNVSHKDSNGFGSAGNTLFSIGIAQNNQDITTYKNGVEVMQNGDVYIIGIGGYDGKNTDTAQTVQQVIASLLSK